MTKQKIFSLDWGSNRFVSVITEIWQESKSSKKRWSRLMDGSLREKVVGHLKEIGYHYVTLDLQGFRSGSMNEVLE